ncbi:MAG: ribose-5-phosphate isomerase B [Parcubacteria group bacterium Gr01-1014_20]|nr:MAG: ribose-5-phosphate isomerase B [Parcubacteria group bacterium Gr01-1014_20]
MVIYFGADHRGFTLKETLKSFVKDQGFEVVDVGNDHYDKDDDYPDFASGVAKKVSLGGDSTIGVLVCGSGAGVDIVANKFPGARSVLGITSDQVYDAKHDDGVNILSISSTFTNEEDAKKMVQVFLETQFGGEERYQRRLDKISQIEEEIKNS